MKDRKEKSIGEVLADHIEKYKIDHPRLSSQQIAKKFGISSSSLNRVENGDVSTPNIDQVIKILDGVGAMGELIGYIDEFYPIVSKNYRQYFCEDSARYNTPPLLETYLRMKDYYRIILVSLLKKNVNEDTIMDYFGRIGVEKYNELIEKGVLPKRMNGSSSHINYSMKPNYETLKTMTLNTISDCVVVDEEERYYLHYHVHALNNEGYGKVLDIVKNAQKNIDKVLKEKKFEGEDLVFYSLTLGHLTPKDN